MTGDEATIFQARYAQNRAIAAGNIDSAATFWTDDVTMRRGLGASAAGRDVYRRLMASFGNPDSAVIYERLVSQVNVSSRWPLAFETGNWFGHLGSAAGPTIISGRYSAQWVKRNGRWLIRSEVFVALKCAESGCSYVAVP